MGNGTPDEVDVRAYAHLFSAFDNQGQGYIRKDEMI